MLTDEQILAAIDASPALTAMAEAGNDGGLAAALPTALPKRVEARWITDISILAVMGADAGEACLQAFEAFAENPAAPPYFKRIVARLKGETGFNIGDPETRANLDALVGYGVFTQEQVDALKAMAEEPEEVSVDRVSLVLGPRRAPFVNHDGGN